MSHATAERERDIKRGRWRNSEAAEREREIFCRRYSPGVEMEKELAGVSELLCFRRWS